MIGRIVSGSVPTSRLDLGPADPLGVFALAILRRVLSTTNPIVVVAADSVRAEALAALLEGLAPFVPTALFPAWDCLPFDRVEPSRGVVGRRTGVLRWLTDPANRPRVVVTTVAGLIQKVPPFQTWATARLTIRPGDAIESDVLAAELVRLGYVADDRVDEPGEFALRGQVVDIHPAAAPRPCRIEIEAGRVSSIRSYAASTQRSVTDTDELVVDPASELVPDEPAPPDSQGSAAVARRSEHRLAEFYPELSTLLDGLPDVRILLDAGVEAAVDGFYALIDDSGDTVRSGSGLYLDRTNFLNRCEAALDGVATAERANGRVLPDFSSGRDPIGALAEFVQSERSAGRRVLIAASDEAELGAVRRRFERRRIAPSQVFDWNGVTASDAPDFAVMVLQVSEGFVVAEPPVTAVPAFAILGRGRSGTGGERSTAFLHDHRLTPGDTVVHLDHGLAALEGLESLPGPEGGEIEAVRLRFADEARLLIPADEIGRLWRYGAEDGTVPLDRLGSDTWDRKRREIEQEIAEAARAVARLAAERAGRRAPVLVPPPGPYGRVVARFPYPPTTDQSDAIDAVLADLAAGRPMDRLVCGDVGFGKTEVAIRAAAAAAFAGRQVAIAAPTTVLVRQHVETFRKRFAGLGIEIAHLSRLVPAAEARRVRSGLADGTIGIVIGTHALVAKGIRFRDLGLVVIDEEQRFGTAHKAKLRALAADVHVLTMTATPIPRTLQAAAIGLQEISLIATPPVARSPVRTAVAPFDGAMVRGALLRERRRGGQSFVVCPRIEDIGPMAGRLAEIVPELGLAIAHGKMPADAVDETMVRFANGDGDVLLATNIIESGLDVPNANTILVWRADRFGLAQLHQLRGRVGRSNRRGTAYLLTDPAAPPGPKALKRLTTLEQFDRLGAGFQVSAHDMDQRGAGDLLGHAQAGHLRSIGTGLYRHLTERALVSARGGTPPEEWNPELAIGLTGRVPADYVPDEAVRLDLYVRLDCLADETGIDDFEEELDDRFGPIPPPLRRMLLLARIRALCLRLRIARVDAGPLAVALTPRPGAAGLPGAAGRDGRMLVQIAEPDPDLRAQRILDCLEAAAPA